MHIKGCGKGPFHRVYDAETGVEFTAVLEANSDEGWLIRGVTDENGFVTADKSGYPLTERIERPIRIEEIPGTSAA